MVNTGYIAFVFETGGGQDEDYNTIPPESSLSEYVACNLATVRKEYKIKIEGNGQYQQAKYSCIIEQDFLKLLKSFDGSVIYSTDILGKDIPMDYVPSGDELIKFSEVPREVNLNEVNYIQLRDADSNELGKFQVHNLEYLNLTKKVKIVV
jgi:hypothetical protein